MTDNELRARMSQLYKDTKLSRQQLIGTAVQLGINYQEEKIKKAIKIVFDTLHTKPK